MKKSRDGFTLLELLTVVSVMAILMALTIPAVSSMRDSLQLSRGSELVSDWLNLARQTAIGRGKSVAVRFFKPASKDAYAVFRSVLVHDDGSEEPVSRLLALPQGVIFSEDSSSSNLFDSSLAIGTVTLPDGEEATSIEFRFRPDGSTDLDPSQSWYTTVALQHDLQENPPKNYTAFLIDPINGTVWVYRP